MSRPRVPRFSLSLTFYRVLLLAYPGSFRRRFARQMAEDLRESLTRERHRGPVLGRARALLPALLDLVRSLPREYVQAWRDRLSEAPARGRAHPLATTLQDLRFALRALRRRPHFSAVAILTLGLGIGAATAMFSVANAVLLEPLPFREPQRLMRPSIVIPPKPNFPAGREDLTWSVPKYEVFKATQASFSASALYKGRQYTLSGGAGPERLQGEVGESAYLGVLGVHAILGRTLTPEDDRPGADRVVLLGHGLWLRRWGGDPSILGQSLTISGNPYTVVGILPRGFRGLSGRAEIFLPFSIIAPQDRVDAWSHSYFMVARLRDGVTPAQARADMAVVARRIAEAFPPPDAFAEGWRATARTLDELRSDPALRGSILLLSGAVGLVLLIACVNLANLLLARAASRRRDVAIRVAVGSGRGRVVRQLMAESLLLSSGAAVLGLALAYLVVEAFRSAGPAARGVLPGDITSLAVIGLDRVEVDGTVLLFTLGVGLGTCILFGLVPALRASRTDLVQNLRDGRAGGGGSQLLRGRIGRDALVVLELALSFVLLMGSGLMLKSFARLNAVDLGFHSEGVLTASVSLPPGDYRGSEAGVFFTALLERVRAIPGVEAAGMNDCPPVSGGCNSSAIRFPERPPVAAGTEPNADVNIAGPGFFETMGISVLRGRAFDGRDRLGGHRVALVSERAAMEFWPGEDPIGRVIAVPRGGDFDLGAEVVGIVGDVRYESVEKEPEPAVYLPMSQLERTGGVLFLRASGDPLTAAGPVRQAVTSLDPNALVTGVRTMDERVATATIRTRFSASLLGFFAAVALALSAMGVFGVLSYLVAQRTREIGIRMALGEGRGSLFRHVLARVVAQTILGIGIGGAVSLGVTRLLGALLFDVSPDDPATLGSIALILALVALAAACQPALRATRVEPVEVLRDG